MVSVAKAMDQLCKAWPRIVSSVMQRTSGTIGCCIYCSSYCFFHNSDSLGCKSTSAPVNAFVFFAQVVPTIFTLSVDGAIQVNHAGGFVSMTYSLPYAIWNPKSLLKSSPQYFTVHIYLISYSSVPFNANWFGVSVCMAI